MKLEYYSLIARFIEETSSHWLTRLQMSENKNVIKMSTCIDQSSAKHSNCYNNAKLLPIQPTEEFQLQIFPACTRKSFPTNLPTFPLFISNAFTHLYPSASNYHFFITQLCIVLVYSNNLLIGYGKSQLQLSSQLALKTASPTARFCIVLKPHVNDLLLPSSVNRLVLR